MSDSSYGQMWPSDAAGEYNKTAFVIDQRLARVRTMVPVKILKVLKQDGKTTATQGDVAGAGFVQVQPMISMVDGAGQSTPHDQIFNIPYTRGYGGVNAVIMDPVVGDVGFMIVADRDISSFKNQVTSNQTQGGNAASNQSVAGSGALTPASDRRFDLADGIYVGGVLNQTPKQYVTFTANGVTIADKNNNVITLSPGGNISITCNGTLSITTSSIQCSGDVIAGYGGADQISLQNHVHGGVTTGSGNTATPVAGT